MNHPQFHHFYRWYGYHSQSWVVKMSLFYPHYIYIYINPIKKSPFLLVKSIEPPFFIVESHGKSPGPFFFRFPHISPRCLRNGKGILAFPSRTHKGVPRIVPHLKEAAGVVTTRRRKPGVAMQAVPSGNGGLMVV